jgi:Flp pilus assembly protein TadG
LRISQACRAALSFWHDRSGQFAVIMAVAAIPLFGLAGMALDYSMLRMRMSAYQSAADNAALTAAISLRGKSGTDSATDWADAEKEGKNAFLAAIKDDYPNASEEELKLTYDGTAQTISATANSSVGTTLTGILGFDKLDFEVLTVVNLPRYPIEISLAVDVTDSMNEMTSASKTKIATLREVGTDFINSIMSNQAADVKVSVVPFAMFNNVSKDFNGKPWFRLFSYGTGGTAAMCPRLCENR